MRTTFATLIAILWLTGMVRANSVELSDALPGHAGMTYFDLMKLVVTDLEADPGDTPEARRIVPYRHIEGDQLKTEPAGALAVQSLIPLEIHADGKMRVTLLADFGPSAGDVTEFVLLSLFDLSTGPKLLDVVEVGRDRLTGFGSPALTPLGHGTDLINIDSDHFNSNEDFVSNEYLFVRNDRFELAASLFTFAVKMCEFALTEEPAASTLRSPGEAYNRIFLTVREQRKTMPDAAQCDNRPPRPFLRQYGAIYRWDERRSRFAAVSGNLNRLDAENDRLMNPR